MGGAVSSFVKNSLGPVLLAIGKDLLVVKSLNIITSYNRTLTEFQRMHLERMLRNLVEAMPSMDTIQLQHIISSIVALALPPEVLAEMGTDACAIITRIFAGQTTPEPQRSSVNHSVSGPSSCGAPSSPASSSSSSPPHAVPPSAPPLYPDIAGPSAPPLTEHPAVTAAAEALVRDHGLQRHVVDSLPPLVLPSLLRALADAPVCCITLDRLTNASGRIEPDVAALATFVPNHKANRNDPLAWHVHLFRASALDEWFRRSNTNPATNINANNSLRFALS